MSTRCLPARSLRPLVALLLAACETYPGYSFVTYGMARPSGPTRNYVRSTSWRGAGVDARFPIRRKMTGSVVVGWNLLHEQTKETIVFAQGAASGTQFRDLHALPLLVGVQLYPVAAGDGIGPKIKPYVGILGGAYLVERRTDLGLFTLLEDQDWHLGVAPQAGLIARMGQTNLLVDARYNYAVPARGMRCAYFGLNLGVAISIE